MKKFEKGSKKSRKKSTIKRDYVNIVALCFVVLLVLDNDLLCLFKDFFARLQIQINSDFFVFLNKFFSFTKLTVNYYELLSLVKLVYSVIVLINIFGLSFFILATFVKKFIINFIKTKFTVSSNKTIFSSSAIYIEYQVFLC